MTPAYSVGLTDGPQTIAFDASGNLWMALEQGVVEFTGAQLIAGGPQAPVSSVSVGATTPLALAFDPRPGNVPIAAARVRSVTPLRSAVRRTR